MRSKQLPKPTAAELEILRNLWKHGPSTVRFVNEELNKKREVGYTTTLKIMQIMFEKNLLKRTAVGRSHVYQPAFRRERMQGMLIDQLLESAFGGSASNLVMQALGNHKTSKAEIRKIREYLDSIEEESHD